MTSGTAAADAASVSMTPWARIKAILGGSSGNLVEWYDWFAYTSTSLYFARHFFPKEDPVGQQLQTAAIFAAGFIARPLGAWLMGIYADRAGRRTALTLSVALSWPITSVTYWNDDQNPRRALPAISDM